MNHFESFTKYKFLNIQLFPSSVLLLRESWCFFVFVNLCIKNKTKKQPFEAYILRWRKEIIFNCCFFYILHINMWTTSWPTWFSVVSRSHSESHHRPWDMRTKFQFYCNTYLPPFKMECTIVSRQKIDKIFYQCGLTNIQQISTNITNFTASKINHSRKTLLKTRSYSMHLNNNGNPNFPVRFILWSNVM